MLAFEQLVLSMIRSATIGKLKLSFNILAPVTGPRLHAGDVPWPSPWPLTD